jgi:hypothetical protein
VDEIYGNISVYSYNYNWWLKWLEDIAKVRQLTARVSERRVQAESSVKEQWFATSTLTDEELEL